MKTVMSTLEYVHQGNKLGSRKFFVNTNWTYGIKGTIDGEPIDGSI